MPNESNGSEINMVQVQMFVGKNGKLITGGSWRDMRAVIIWVWSD